MTPALSKDQTEEIRGIQDSMIDAGAANVEVIDNDGTEQIHAYLPPGTTKSSVTKLITSIGLMNEVKGKPQLSDGRDHLVIDFTYGNFAGDGREKAVKQLCDKIQRTVAHRVAKDILEAQELLGGVESD